MERVLQNISTWLAAACLATAAVAVHAQAPAAAYPTKPVKLVVPFPPGGSLDIAGRLIAQKLTETWGQSVVVENKPGAGGNIGADFVAKSPPDGYTILLGALSTHAVNPSLYKSMPYDAAKDFAPITLDRDHAQRPRRQRVAAGEQREGIHRLREGQSRQACIRLGQQRQRRPSRRRAVQGRDGHRRRARARSRAARRPRRRCSPATRSSCSTISPMRWRR